MGSNQGDRVAIFSSALKLLSEQLGIIKSISPIYETAAWGKTDQPNFLNQAILISSEQNAVKTLSIINQIEMQLGRQRTEHWGQRTLDIDILLFNNEIVHSSKLVIPHPELPNRKFALVPLCSIAPNFTHPVLAKDIITLLEECNDSLDVFLYQ
jgi:2-amino-4-hydroxy-6-hydroxymethyldihydropteridine diphosphokinase